jgi:hypothetical protein
MFRYTCIRIAGAGKIVATKSWGPEVHKIFKTKLKKNKEIQQQPTDLKRN